MSQPQSLEALLSASDLRYGRITLFIMDGKWSAGITHYQGHMVHQWKAHDDPVTALRSALVEDERRCRDLERRYEAAPKLGTAIPVISPPPLDDMEDLLG